MVGRREVDGLLLKRLNSFFLEPSFPPSDSRLSFPRPESMRAEVADMMPRKWKRKGRSRRQLTAVDWNG
jgi:hypothetical protein